MAQFKHDWETLDPQIDRLKQNGLDASAIARQLKIAWTILINHRPDLRKDAAPSQVPAQVPQKVPERYSTGTQPPDLNTLAAALMPRLLDALKPAVESWLTQQVPPQVPELVPTKVLDEVPGPSAVEYLQGTAGYPHDPQRKAQFHWHVPAGELWELRAVAEGLQIDMSLLLRKLWRAFMRTPEAQAGLERSRTRKGTRRGTRPGTSRSNQTGS
jgi:hypothetical protein